MSNFVNIRGEKKPHFINLDVVAEIEIEEKIYVDDSSHWEIKVIYPPTEQGFIWTNRFNHFDKHEKAVDFVRKLVGCYK